MLWLTLKDQSCIVSPDLSLFLSFNFYPRLAQYVGLFLSKACLVALAFSIRSAKSKINTINYGDDQSPMPVNTWPVSKHITLCTLSTN
jgi:hypothetical protein